MPEHLDGGLQRGQLAVGGEDVELAVVLAESRAGVGAASSLESSRQPWSSPTMSLVMASQQLVAIVGEILQDLYRRRR